MSSSLVPIDLFDDADTDIHGWAASVKSGLKARMLEAASAQHPLVSKHSLRVGPFGTAEACVATPFVSDSSIANTSMEQLDECTTALKASPWFYSAPPVSMSVTTRTTQAERVARKHARQRLLDILGAVDGATPATVGMSHLPRPLRHKRVNEQLSVMSVGPSTYGREGLQRGEELTSRRSAFGHKASLKFGGSLMPRKKAPITSRKEGNAAGVVKSLQGESGVDIEERHKTAGSENVAPNAWSAAAEREVALNVPSLRAKAAKANEAFEGRGDSDAEKVDDSSSSFSTSSEDESFDSRFSWSSSSAATSRAKLSPYSPSSSSSSNRRSGASSSSFSSSSPSASSASYETYTSWSSSSSSPSSSSSSSAADESSQQQPPLERRVRRLLILPVEAATAEERKDADEATLRFAASDGGESKLQEGKGTEATIEPMGEEEGKEDDEDQKLELSSKKWASKFSKEIRKVKRIVASLNQQREETARLGTASLDATFKRSIRDVGIAPPHDFSRRARERKLAVERLAIIKAELKEKRLHYDRKRAAHLAPPTSQGGGAFAMHKKILRDLSGRVDALLSEVFEEGGQEVEGGPRSGRSHRDMAVASRRREEYPDEKKRRQARKRHARIQKKRDTPPVDERPWYATQFHASYMTSAAAAEQEMLAREKERARSFASALKRETRKALAGEPQDDHAPSFASGGSRQGSSRKSSSSSSSFLQSASATSNVQRIMGFVDIGRSAGRDISGADSESKYEEAYYEKGSSEPVFSIMRPPPPLANFDFGKRRSAGRTSVNMGKGSGREGRSRGPGGGGGSDSDAEKREAAVLVSMALESGEGASPSTSDYLSSAAALDGDVRRRARARYELHANFLVGSHSDRARGEPMGGGVAAPSITPPSAPSTSTWGVTPRFLDPQVRGSDASGSDDDDDEDSYYRAKGRRGGGGSELLLHAERGEAYLRRGSYKSAPSFKAAGGREGGSDGASSSFEGSEDQYMGGGENERRLVLDIDKAFNAVAPRSSRGLHVAMSAGAK